MSWRELAEQRAIELDRARQDIRRLEHHVARLGDRRAHDEANVTDSQIVEKLRKQSQPADGEKKDLENALAQTILKNEQLEGELSLKCQQNHELQQKLVDTEELAKVAQLAVEKEAQEAHRLANNLEAMKRVSASLKADKERLSRQLQAEKSDNTARCGWMQSTYGCKDEDDEEMPSIHIETGMSIDADTVPPARQIPLTTPCIEMASPSFKPPKSSEFFGTQTSKIIKPLDGEKSTAAGVRKRKRNEQEEIDEDLLVLHLDNYKLPTTPRARTRPTTSSPVAHEEEFEFKAILGYDDDGGLDYFFSKDLDDCDVLLERIKRTEEIWESCKGVEWQHEFVRPDYKPERPPCVTSKLAGKRSKWRPECQGRYACIDCVKHGRPCFTWMEREDEGGDCWSMWEFRLLPLHDSDGRGSVVDADMEARYWVNEDTEFSKADVVKEDEEDDDYVE